MVTARRLASYTGDAPPRPVGRPAATGSHPAYTSRPSRETGRGGRCAGLAAWAVLVGAAAAAGDVEIRGVGADKARYLPGEDAVVHVDIENTAATPVTSALKLEVWHLRTPPVHSETIAIEARPKTKRRLQVAWTTPYRDFCGYIARVSTASGEAGWTAFDVSSDWARYPRCGFLTGFGHGLARDPEEVSRGLLAPLSAEYHLDALQFYDWSWTHQALFKLDSVGDPEPLWKDWTGRTIHVSVLRQLLGLAHERRVACLPYVALYLGDLASGPVLPDAWGLFDGSSPRRRLYHDVGSTPTFAVFNPARPEWRDHICREYEAPLLRLGFDGIHIDQLGTMGRSDWFDSSGAFVDLERALTPLVNRARAMLPELARGNSARMSGDEKVAFNLVDAAIDAFAYDDVVRGSTCDVLYGELWGGAKTYTALRDLIRNARTRTGGKALVLAAYMNREEPAFDVDSVLLADAAMFACGAYHLEVGDGGRLLEGEYFPGTGKVTSPDLRSRLRRYYDFIVGYENLLFDPDLLWGDGGDQWVAVAAVPGGPSAPVVAGFAPTAKKVWWLARRNALFDVIHLVNLSEETDDEWRNATPTPTPFGPFRVTYRMGPAVSIKAVHVASPDSAGASLRPTPVPFTTGADGSGPFVSFDIPRLEYWTMAWIERDLTRPPDDRYQAESAVLTGATVHAGGGGASGSGSVELPASTFDGEGVSFFVVCPREARYELVLRYAGDAGARRSAFVDGLEAGTFEMPATGSDAAWSTSSLHRRLRAGPHQVVVWLKPGDGGRVLVDRLDLEFEENGLWAEYFERNDLTYRCLARRDAAVNFSWGYGAPDVAVPCDDFSVRWRGEIVPGASGTYTLRATTDDGVAVHVDGRTAIRSWKDQAPTESTGRVDLVAGKPVDLVVEYYDHLGNASAVLSWSVPPTGATEVVPSSRLRPPGMDLETGEDPPAIFRRGDVDGDGTIGFADVGTLLARVRAGSGVPCEAAGDVDDDDRIDVADVTYLLEYLYKGGSAPAVPFLRCGRDPSPAGFSCESVPCRE